MKNLQEAINNHVMNSRNHKRYLAALIAMSMLVSFMVPFLLIEPAVSMTNDSEISPQAAGAMLTNYANADGNDGYSPKERSEVELLVGNGVEWASDCTTASEVIEKAKEEYFLGIAYDFSLFLEGTATLKNADAEGRVAVGGNLIFTGGYCYQVGSGNFGYMTALKDTDDYQGITNFAHAIVGGYMKNIHPLSTGNNRMRINQLTTEKGGHQGYGETLYFPPTEDMFKRFVVGADINNDDFTHMHCSNEKYNANGSHDSVSVNELAEMYKQPEDGVINFTSTFEWLRERSIKLGEKTATGEATSNGNKVTFKIPDGMENAKTVYFDLPDNVDYSKLEEIRFENVPKDTTEMIVRETETDELKKITKNIPKCNLVINAKGTSFDIRGVGNTTKTIIKYTDNTEDEISNNIDLEKRDEYNKNDIHHNNEISNDNGAVVPCRSNNHPASSKILYNFPNAKTGTINGNFNGTIFAPDANIKSDDSCTGHLSGALIAKSFEGGLEFGYRPYRGTSDILGSNSGYVVPVDKLIKDTETYLPNASFTITDNNTNKIVDRWKSGDATEFVVIPSLVDFSGKINYNTETNQYVKTYTIAESSSPNGYIKTDKHYTVSVTETVNKDYLLKFGEGTIPQVVDVEIIIKSSDTEEANFPKTIRFQYRDSYKDTDEAAKGLEQSQRKVLVFGEDNTVSKVFALNINTVGGSQTVTQLGTIDNWTADCDVEITTTTKAVETTTQTVETTTEAIATENEISEEQNNDIQTESVPEVEPVNENANAADEVLSVQSADNAVTQYKKIKPIESQAITPDGKDLKSSWEFTDNNKRYYYDNNSMMVIPLPDSNLKFENKPGLLFSKVDNNGEPVTGATIQLYKGESEISKDNEGNDIWVWDSTKSTYLIDISKLEANTTYRFHEDIDGTPEGYETADDIYFTVNADKKSIEYWKKGEQENKTTTPTGDEKYPHIEMVDIKKSGAVIKLGKYAYKNGVLDENTKLDGAEFQLYANKSGGDVLVYPKDSSNFTLNTNTDGTLNLFDEFKEHSDNVNEEYVQNGYLKPGRYYLKEIKSPNLYDSQDKFGFSIKANTDGTYEITPVSSSLADEGDMYLSTGDGNPVLIITGKLLEMAKDNPDENFVENLWKVNQVHISSTGNSNSWGGNLSITNKSSYTFNEILTSSGKNADEIKFIRFMQWEDKNKSYNEATSPYYNGAPASSGGSDSGSGSGSDNGTGLINGMNGNNGTVTVSGALLKAAKEQPNKTFVRLDKTGDGQIHILTNSITNIDQGQIANDVNKSEYTLNDIFLMAQSEGKASNINDITTVRFMEWTGGSALTGTALLEISVPEEPSQPTTPTTPATDLLDLTVGADGEIKIPNKKAGADMKVSVKKVWSGDDGFESSRPDSIEVELLRNKPDGTQDKNFTTEKKTLNATNNWKAEWANLERLVEGTENTYKYYIKEISDVPNYRVSYSENNTVGLSTTGTITITNTLQKDEISITKKWENASETNLTKPTQLNVTLKFTVNNTQQTKTVTLTPKDDSEDYTGSYEIPKGATDVSVEENSVPPGWKLKENGIEQKGNHFTITNVPDTTQLTVKKEWVNDTQSSRPQQIHFKLYRKAQSGGSSGDNADAPNFDPNLTNNLVPDYTDDKYTSKNITQYNDYARLLQYSLYFYDANMCGSEVSEKSAFSKTNANGWRDDCHTYSGYVDGGYHDAGDHVMFGLPQGFTASTLGWSYYEFKDSYDTLGLTEHYKTIMKYFCDFFEKSIRTRNNTVEILVQKGDSSTDHNYWGAPETQSNYGSEIWVSDKGGNIAAQYAAALAQYSLNFPDDANSKSYLAKAIEFYNFATSHPTDYDVSNYDSKESADDIAWAAGWLYLATGKNNNDYLKKLNSCPNIDWLYNWNNVAMGAACLKAEIDGDWSTVNSAIDSNFKNCNAKVGNYICLNDWGSARYSTLMQFVALVSDKNNNTETYKELCQGQMAYLLGDNSIESNGNTSTCFVTGFAPNSAKYPHHRAASGTSEAKTDNKKYQHTLVGALVGGPNTSGQYIDITDNGQELCYQVNEVALDYNAGLVGAAAGLYAVYGTGATYSNVNATPQNDESADANTLSAIGPVKLNLNREVSVLADDDESYTWEQTFKAGEAYALPSNVLGKKITSIDVYYTIGDYWGYFKYGHTHQYDDGGKRYKQLGEVAYDDIKNKNMVTISSLSCTDNITDFSFGEIGNATISKLVIHYTDSPDPPSEETTTSNTTTTQKQETTTTVATNTTPTTPSGLVAHEYPFNGQTITNLNLEHVKKIAIVFDSNVTANGMLKLNDDYENTILPGNTDPSQKGNNKWDINNSNRFEYGEVDMTVTKFEFNIWGGDSCNTGKIIFYTEAEGLTLTPTNAEIEEGGEITLTASGAEGSVSWEIDDPNNLINTNSQSGNTCTITAKDNVNGTVTITAKADGKTKTATITIKAKEITGLPEAVKLHVGKLAQLSPVPADNVSYNSGNEAVATVDNNGNITAKSTGDTVITVSRNGESVSVPVHVLGNLSITGNGIMNKNATQQLTAANAVGAVKWSINPDSNEPKIKIDPDTGVVTSETGTGNATVIATDSDGTTAEFNIIVNLTAVQPDLPEGAEQVQNVGEGGIITLTKDDLKSDGSWQKEIANLPKTDSSGNVYVYYLEEVDAQGTPIRTCIAGNNGVNYYPVEYINNGMTLNDSDKTITVKNEASEKPDNPDYTLPNTGGIGTGGFTTAGGAIIIGSTALYILSKRRRKKNVVR